MPKETMTPRERWLAVLERKVPDRVPMDYWGTLETTLSLQKHLFHHDDGNITRILPDLVQLGIDILNPIQWRADTMERQSLKDQYGTRLVFQGGMDYQYTLSFGCKEDVRQEVMDNLQILG